MLLTLKIIHKFFFPSRSPLLLSLPFFLLFTLSSSTKIIVKKKKKKERKNPGSELLLHRGGF